MGKHAVLVVGPGGSGKSTFCHAVQQHCDTEQRQIHVANLDPAAESIKYQPSVDIRDIINVGDATEMLDLGPNGGLVYCMEYFMANIEVFLELIGDFPDDFLLLDCPGQIELYTHMDVLSQLGHRLQAQGYYVCSVHLMDSTFLTDTSRFLSGALTTLSCMIRLELPHLSVVTKMDLLRKNKKKSARTGGAGRKKRRTDEQGDEDEDDEGEDDGDDVDQDRPYDSADKPEEDSESEFPEELSHFFDMNLYSLLCQVEAGANIKPRYARLTQAVGRVLEDYSMVQFIPLDVTSESSLTALLAHIDSAVQYGEDVEVRIPRDAEEEDNDD